jgi:hypothetical protein
MKRSINSTFAAAMLIALAMTGTATAAPPSDTADMDNTALYEDVQQGQVAEDEAKLSEEEQQAPVVEDESQSLAVSTTEDASSDDVSGAKTVEEDNTSAAQTSKPSENRTFKNELKHALLGRPQSRRR